LRGAAAGEGYLLTDYSAWEDMRLAGGSSTLVDALADAVGERLRLGAVVEAIDVGATCAVTLAGGERIEAEAVVCALPVGPLRDVRLTGLSDARLASLQAQREVLAYKAVIAFDGPVWRDHGWSGLAASEREVGGFWPQSQSTLSALLGPEQVGYLSAETAAMRDRDVLAALERLMGPVQPRALLWREWGTDPFTRGYVTHWAPGDVLAAGPLHGTHEPPFYVCGSDHWAAGYMEGAVATGRAAARSLVEGRAVSVYER
jgi:monoamine oxidase